MSVRQTINKPSSSPSSAMEEEMPSVVAPELSTIQPEQSTIQPEVPAAKWTPAIAPEGFNKDYCYEALTRADQQATTTLAMTEKNRRNISRLAKTAVNLNARMRAKERRGIKG